MSYILILSAALQISRTIGGRGDWKHIKDGWQDGCFSCQEFEKEMGDMVSLAEAEE